MLEQVHLFVMAIAFIGTQMGFDGEALYRQPIDLQPHTMQTVRIKDGLYTKDSDGWLTEIYRIGLDKPDYEVYMSNKEGK